MFEGFDRSAIDFLWGIRLNNDKNWYESHKEEYRQNLAKPMKSLCDELFCDFYSEIGYETVSSVSRIVKDARFLTLTRTVITTGLLSRKHARTGGLHLRSTLNFPARAGATEWVCGAPVQAQCKGSEMR